MQPKDKPRWPTVEEMIANARQGVIDDREAAVPPYALDEWEIRGEAADQPAPVASEDVPAHKRRRRPRTVA